MSFSTFRFRIKDASAKRRLESHAVACNQVWNYLAAIHRQVTLRRYGCRQTPRLTVFDLIKLTTGCAADLGLHSDTVSAICRQFAASRDQHPRAPRFRASFGPKRSLGWVPFISRAVKLDEDAIVYRKQRYRFWRSRDLQGDFRTGAFLQDSRGRWYLDLTCAVADTRPRGSGQVGIDLGLKTLATLSSGEKIPALQHYRKHEAALSKARRANNRRRVSAISAKILNSRRHHLHEQSARIARENSLIVVGNVKATALMKTRMAKSVSDAGWSAFRHMLRYKANRHGAVYIEASERFSSQTCSACGTLPASRPKGIAGLGIRRWECSDCGALHDRDVNAALNILRVGLECQPPVGEISAKSCGAGINAEAPD